MGTAQEDVEQAVNAFAGNDAGRSIVVNALRGARVRVAVRADVARPAASLLKLALVGAIYEAVEEGRLDPRADASVGDLPVTGTRSILAAFEAGHRLSLGELCGLCLLTSDNPIAQHLLEQVGPEAVNRYLRAVGCARTRLEAGFSDAELDAPATGNVTTAREALELMSLLLARGGRLALALNNNLRATRIPLRLPPGVRAPNKTGSLPGVVNDVAVVYGERTDLGLAFLCEGQSDPALTGMQIGNCVGAIRRAVDEELREYGLSDAVMGWESAASARW